MRDRLSGAPVSSRTSRVDTPTPSAPTGGATAGGRAVVMPKSVPPPRPSESVARAADGPKSVRAPSSTPRLPDSCPGSSGAWRPLEALKAADAVKSVSSSIQPSTLSMPPAPSSLEALAKPASSAGGSTGRPEGSGRNRFGAALKVLSWGAALCVLGIGVGIGTTFLRVDGAKKSSGATAARPSPVARDTRAATPPPPVAQASSPEVMDADEIVLDDPSTPPARRRRAPATASVTAASDVPVLPSFPESSPPPKGAKLKGDKRDQTLAEEAKELANKQLESVL